MCKSKCTVLSNQISISKCQISPLTFITLHDGIFNVSRIAITFSRGLHGLFTSNLQNGTTINFISFTGNMFESTGISVTNASHLEMTQLACRQNQFVMNGLLIRQMSNVRIYSITMIGNTVWYNSLISTNSATTKMTIHLSKNTVPRILNIENKSHCHVSNSMLSENRLSEAIYVKDSTFSFETVKLNENKGLSLIYLLQSNISLSSISIASDIAPTTKTIYFNTKSTRNLKVQIQNVSIVFNKGIMKHPIFDLKLGTSTANVSNVNIDLKFWRNGMQVSEISSDFNPKFNIRHTLSDLTVQCPKNYLVKEENEITLEENIVKSSCKKCDRGLYSLDKDSKAFFFNLTTVFKYQLFKSKSIPLVEAKCLPCPVGGICIDEIKSKANFYGYITKANTVKFRPCPTDYCCHKGKCKSINSCQRNRTGTLCGSCKPDSFENYFSTHCVPKKDCHSSAIFWVLFVLFALIITLGLLYGDKFKVLFGKLAACMKCIAHRCSKQSDTDLLTDDDEIDSAQDLIHLTDLQTGKCQEKPNIIIAVAKELKCKPKATTSGIFNILISFYQIKELMSVKFSDTETESRVSTFLSKLFNLNLIIVQMKSVCPNHNSNAITKGLIKNYLMPIVMVSFVVAILAIYTVISFVHRRMVLPRITKNNNNGSDDEDEDNQRAKLTFPSRLALCYIKILLCSYKNIATFSIVLFHCVRIRGDLVLFILGDEKCFQWWQRLDIIFFIIWVLLFPFALSVSYRMFMEDKLSMPEFLLCITFVPSLIWFQLKRKNTISTRLLSDSSQRANVANILAPMFEESYRKLEKRYSGKTFIFWETWRLYQRLILGLVTTLESNPVIRICYISPVILSFVFVYIIARPYKPELVVLHWMEVIMLLAFCFQMVSNMFRAFLYVFEIPNNNPIPVSIDILRVMDYLISPILVLVYFYVLKPIFKKLFQRF